jgi:hypothetical protein
MGVLLGVASAACSPSTGSDAGNAPAGAAASPAPAPTRVSAGWSVTDGLDAPESAYVDAASGSIFVSVIGGQPTARDGNGRIMKLGLDGRVVSASWVTGLNAPKGLRSHNGTLWTADIDEVVAIDIAAARIASRARIDGVEFLNDVAVADDGTVYVSETIRSRIYALKDGQAVLFAEGDDLEHPNGLLVESGRLVVAAWGKPEPDFSTKVPGRLYALDLNTRAKTLITSMPSGNFDGLEADGRGGYIVTDWNKGQLLQISGAGEIRSLRQFAPGTADHAFVPADRVAVVPHMSENKVAAYDLSDVLKQ